MKAFRPSELDALSRAFYRALDFVSPAAGEVETAKTILMTGILDAAKAGELDEDRLVHRALCAMTAYEESVSVERSAWPH